MGVMFDVDHGKLAADPRFAEIAEELSALSPIDSQESFNRYCREACSFWNREFPQAVGETAHLARLVEQLTITRQWGGVVVTLHEHPRVEKYLAVRKGGYLALEMHEQKD